MRNGNMYRVCIYQRGSMNDILNKIELFEYGAPGSPEMRSGPKTGSSMDYVMTAEKGTTRRNNSGFAAPKEVYYDAMAPENVKLVKKQEKWLTRFSKFLQN